YPAAAAAATSSISSLDLEPDSSTTNILPALNGGSSVAATEEEQREETNGRVLAWLAQVASAGAEGHDEAEGRACRERMTKQEAQYIRFLRTHEASQNFGTVKIVGKGAFGEVKTCGPERDE
ncbi:MAG: hypothetical protein Q9224_003925, partial [Gallowayella concinna]